MSRVLALVEGRTEQTFVREVLAPGLSSKGVFLSATMIGKSGHKGGVRVWASARRDIMAALKQDLRRCCTTMLDYYALPGDWPGSSEAREKPFDQAASVIERAIHGDICRELGDSFDPRRLIPYIQMHEFEALLFSDTDILSGVLPCPEAKSALDQIVAECKEPEGIDDNPKTAPSKRLLDLAAGYQKVLHGAIAAQRIGLARMRTACPHFRDWLERLEALRR